MPSISEIYQKAKKKNVLSGIIIADLITFISYIIFPSGIFFFGDLHMIIGVSIGTYFGLSEKKKDQSEIKIGLFVGFLGAFLAGISMAFFEWGLYIITTRFSTIALLFYIFVFTLESIIIGLPIGLLFSLYFKKKRKKMVQGSRIDESFYKSLEDS